MPYGDRPGCVAGIDGLVRRFHDTPWVLCCDLGYEVVKALLWSKIGTASLCNDVWPYVHLGWVSHGVFGDKVPSMIVGTSSSWRFGNVALLSSRMWSHVYAACLERDYAGLAGRGRRYGHDAP